MQTGNNKYIGARYVPLIDGEWKVDKSYEPLTVVLYTDGNSYTSKTYPPKGTPPTNKTYWELTGNYNAQVEQYRAETAVINEQLTGALNKYNSFVNKQFAIYSDSYGDITLPYHGWVDKISEITGKEVHNMSVAGSTSVNIATNFDNYAYADYYVFVFGVNDWVNNLTPLQTRDAIYTILSKVRAVNAIAPVYFMTPIRYLSANNDTLGRVVYLPLEYYRQAIWTGVRNFGGQVISGLKYNGGVNPDGLHPLANTAYLLAYDILDSILRGGDVRDFNNEIRVVPSEGYFEVVGGKTAFYYQNGINYTAGVYNREHYMLKNENVNSAIACPYSDNVGKGGFSACFANITDTGLHFECGYTDVNIGGIINGIKFEFVMKGHE
jgi:hypothetical protein